MLLADAGRAVVFTSYRQINDVCIQAHLFNLSVRLRNVRVVVHNNHAEASNNLLAHVQRFPNRHTTLLWTTNNAGFQKGPIEAMDQILPLLQRHGCHCALHLHPDVFIVDEARLMSLMDSYCAANSTHVWRLNRAFGTFMLEPSFDAFMFKPSVLPSHAFDLEAVWSDRDPKRPEWHLKRIADRFNSMGEKATTATLSQQWEARYTHNSQGPALAQWQKAIEDGTLLERLEPDKWGLVHVHNAWHAACPGTRGQSRTRR